MQHRRQMSKKASRKNFRKGAVKTNRKNMGSPRPMRGGIRL